MRSLIGSILNQTPVSYTPRARGLFPTVSNRNDAIGQMQAMGAVGTLFAVVDRTANAASVVDWKLFRKSQDNRRRYEYDGVDSRVEVTRHAALNLWNKPNRFYTRQEFVETEQQHIDLTGEGWWVIERDERSTVPIGIWPVRPDRMMPVPSPDEFLSGYMYLGPEGEKVPLGLDQVIQIKRPNPMDPYRGMGAVQSIMTDLDSSRYSAEWNRNFFLNGAEPGGIIEVPESLSDPQFEELRERWNEQHRGVSNAHRVAILEHGKWVERKFSQKDMQFAELRGVSREVILEAFGMAEFAIGRIKDVNRATADASRAWFAEQMTIPRLERFKQALNNDFLPLFDADPNLEFDYCDPVPLDRDADNNERTSKASAYKSLVDAGAHPDDAAEAVGLPPMRTVNRSNQVPAEAGVGANG
jgi:HK97 family phage portal protein